MDKAKGVGETPRPLSLQRLLLAGLPPFLAIFAGSSTAKVRFTVRSSRCGAIWSKQVAKVPFGVEKVRCIGVPVSV